MHDPYTYTIIRNFGNTSNLLTLVSMGRNFFTFSLCVFFCQLLKVDAAIKYLNITCVIDYGNFTEGSVYQENVNLLLPDLSSQASIKNFYNTSAGDVSNRVYGMYHCRGDMSSDICAECIKAAAQEIEQRCPLYMEAVIWYEECLLRYSNKSIFSVVAKFPSLSLWSLRNVSNFDQGLAPVLAKTMKTVINNAARTSSRGHFDTSQNNWTVFDNVYTLAQCTPDLDEFDCTNCLQAALSSMVNEYKGSTYVGIFYPSCQLRYDTNSRFYKEITLPAPAPSPPNARTPGEFLIDC